MKTTSQSQMWAGSLSREGGSRTEERRDKSRPPASGRMEIPISWSKELREGTTFDITLGASPTYKHGLSEWLQGVVENKREGYMYCIFV